MAMAVAGQQAAHGIEHEGLQQLLGRGRHILPRRPLRQLEDERAHGVVIGEIAVDLAVVIDAEMPRQRVIEGRLAIGGQARELALMAVDAEAQRLGGEAIGEAQAVDALGLRQPVIAAIEGLDRAVAEAADRILHVVAAAIGRIEQRLRPIRVEQRRQGMGAVMVEESEMGLRPEAEIGEEGRPVEHGEGIRAPVAHALGLHVFVLLAARHAADSGGEPLAAGEMREIALREGAAAQQHRIHLRAGCARRWKGIRRSPRPGRGRHRSSPASAARERPRSAGDSRHGDRRRRRDCRNRHREAACGRGEIRFGRC